MRRAGHVGGRSHRNCPGNRGNPGSAAEDLRSTPRNQDYRSRNYNPGTRSISNFDKFVQVRETYNENVRNFVFRKLDKKVKEVFPPILTEKLAFIIDKFDLKENLINELKTLFCNAFEARLMREINVNLRNANKPTLSVPRTTPGNRHMVDMFLQGRGQSLRYLFDAVDTKVDEGRRTAEDQITIIEKTDNFAEGRPKRIPRDSRTYINSITADLNSEMLAVNMKLHIFRRFFDTLDIDSLKSEIQKLELKNSKKAAGVVVHSTTEETAKLSDAEDEDDKFGSGFAAKPLSVLSETADVKEGDGNGAEGKNSKRAVLDDSKNAD